MGRQYDIEHIMELTKQLAPSCETWDELADKVGARIGGIHRKTLTKIVKGQAEINFRDFNALKHWVMHGEEPNMSMLAEAILTHLKKGKNRDTVFSMLEMCEQFDRSPSSIEEAVAELQGLHYNIQVTDDKQMLLPSSPPPSFKRIPFGQWMQDKVHRYGVISDTHLSNRNARLDALECLYDWYAAEGIEVVLHAGNILDGEFKFNRHELLAHGVEGQIAYTAKHYPRRDGIVTKFLTADDHEGWWAHDTGLDVGHHMESTFVSKYKRDDLEWLGHVEVDLELHPDNPKAILRVMHPGGGTAYAISYSPQKIVESWQGGEKPSVCVMGHFHKYGFFYPREVWCILAGCVEDQTMFMRKKKLAAHVGGSILEIHMTSQGGVGEVIPRFKPFYDKGYYERWDYLNMWLDK